MKRVALFAVTNIGVLLVIGALTRALGVDKVFLENGISYTNLLIYSAITGFAGALISLALSKSMAKMSTGAKVISSPSNPTERWLLETVTRQAKDAGIGMPEVAIYDGPANAFATGARRNAALVAVSTGLLEAMDKREVEAVLAHEVAHVANGDMVTMTLIQGVMNTFVVFLSRVIGFAVDAAMRKGERGNRGPGLGYTVVSMIMQVVFGILASMVVAWFSRQREFRADAGAAKLMGERESMIGALEALERGAVGQLPKSLTAAGIGAPHGLAALFSTHPPIAARVEALRALT